MQANNSLNQKEPLFAPLAEKVAGSGKIDSIIPWQPILLITHLCPTYNTWGLMGGEGGEGGGGGGGGG